MDKKINIPQETMEDAIRELGSKLHEGTEGLFYYSGHGVWVSGQNYLIPIGARIVKEKKDEKLQNGDSCWFGGCVLLVAVVVF